jgi:hypothetical protein
LPLNSLPQISQIISSLTELKRMYQLNSELLEQLAVTCDFIKENGIHVPNEEKFCSLLNKTYALLSEIQADEPKTLVYKKLSDDGYHEPQNRRRVNRTEKSYSLNMKSYKNRCKMQGESQWI